MERYIVTVLIMDDAIETYVIRFSLYTLNRRLVDDIKKSRAPPVYVIDKITGKR